VKFYHVYSASVSEDENASCLMQLRYTTAAWDAAVRAAGILFSGRPVTLMPARRGLQYTPPPGMVAGAPVWVRNKQGHGPVVMITEHPSEEAAALAMTAVRLAWRAPASRPAAVSE
jgi:hypothetical protein